MAQRVRPLEPDRPSVAEVVPLVRALFAGNCVGCCMHAQLDDGNLEDHWFGDSGRASVLECGDADHLKLFDMLARMSVTQRKKVRDTWDRPPANWNGVIRKRLAGLCNWCGKPAAHEDGYDCGIC